MVRGTTPTLRFTLPIDVENIEVCVITMAQASNIVLEKALTDCEAKGQALALHLTQTDTLLFAPGSVDVQLRVRLKDGTALASDIIRTTAQRILHDGEV